MQSPELTTPSANFTQLKDHPIAIIGMASIFAKAGDLTQYWENILAKVDAITDVPADRWDVADYYDPDPKVPDKSYCKRGAFMPEVEFDPTEFGLPPNILEATDVSQLISLVVARDALLDAGYGEDNPQYRSTTGCILGVVGMSAKLYLPLVNRLQYPIWERVLRKAGVSEADTARIVEKIKLAYVGWEENSFPGALANVVAGRIANRFDLGGTNCVIDAACGTSLAAMRMAVMELVEGRADMMITGGVDTDNSIGVYMSFSKTPAFSKGENVRTFDAESNGMMAGEGVGMVVLKRLSDAQRDGDRIYAVIRGIGSSSDGRFKSIYAPRPEGQTLALQRAYAEAGYDPLTSGLIEAHGTGTPAGDPAEFRGLKAAFGLDGDRRNHIALGSVKSQIAHTKGAAGVAGLIKIALALHHKVLPPTINVKTPNPKLDLQDSPFYINTEARPWFRTRPDLPRRAGVSAFGFGGTNFHFALEEFQGEQDAPYRIQSVPAEFVISAPNEQGLKGKIKTLLTDPAALHRGMIDTNIPHDHARVGFSATDAAEAADKAGLALSLLESKPEDTAWDHPRGIHYRREVEDPQGKVVALFAGQGSQYVNMGRETALAFPAFRQVLANMDSLFSAGGEENLTRSIYPPPTFTAEAAQKQESTLTQTQLAQPAIGAVSAAQYEMLTERGFRADFCAGHSFGELSALWAAGVLSRADFFRLAKARGEAMAPKAGLASDPGTMLAVKGDAEKVKAELAGFPEVVLANWNSNNQVVLAGSRAAIDAVNQHLSGAGYSTVALPVSAAFHTPLVGHAQEPFAQALRSATFNDAKIPVYSNSSALRHSTPGDEIRTSMEGHILSPVLFRDEIQNIHADGGRIFVEFGPRTILTNLVRNILAGQPHEAIALNGGPRGNSLEDLAEAAVILRVLGVSLQPLDRWQRPEPQKPQRTKSPVTVMLSAAGYVSPKTRKAFSDALEDGFQITPTIVEKVVTIPAAPLLPANPTPPKDVADMADTSASIYTRAIQETAQIHQLYLQNEETATRSLAEIHRRILELISDPAKLTQALPVIQVLERTAAQIIQHQAETRTAHQSFLRSMETYAGSFAGLAGGIPLPVTAPPPTPAPQAVPVPAQAVPVPVPAAQVPVPAAQVPVPAAPVPPLAVPVAATAQPAAPASSGGYAKEALKDALLSIVSEKTGYPVEMLEMDADMEADLGIDSIKRVEIMGAMRDQFPALPAANPEAFAAVHTLGETLAYLHDSAPEAPAAQTGVVASQPSVVVSQPTGTAPAPSASADQVSNDLLAIVSEKTGYPVDMLEMDADLESDLGIDSIKRVEIMGALREQHPELPEADPEAFANVHTLAEILAYLTANTPHRPQQPEEKAPPASPAVSPAGYAPLAGQVQEDLLAIVSEKTGYPVDMLELDVDIESDLGIDSIKKVEILGALREQHPDLPQPDPQAFADAHTLSDILTYLAGGSTSSEEVPAAQESVAAATPDLGESSVLLRGLPPADELVFSLPEGSVCLVTDNGNELAGQVCARLESKGWKPLRVSWPATVLPGAEPGAYRLEDTSEEAITAFFALIEKEAGKPAAFIHLHPCCQLSPDQEKDLIKAMFLTAKHLKAPLTENANRGAALFMTVTRLDGQFGLSGQGDYNPLAGGLAGLVKTANREWPQVICKSVDIDPAIGPEAAADAIVTEIFDPNHRLVEIGYAEEGRVTLTASPNPAVA